MSKTPVIIIPENHMAIGQKLIEKYAPLIKDIFSKHDLRDINVLNYSEGNYASNFYNCLYGKDEFLQHTCEKTIGDDSLELYNSVKHGLSIINLIRGTFDYYKKLRRTNPDHIPIGLCDLPMDDKYIKMLAYEIYEFPIYVPDKKHKYYAYINAIYKNIINNQPIEKYEEYMIGLLNEAKQFFTDYLQFFNFHEMLDDLKQFNLETRLTNLNKYSAKLRKILDARVIEFIPKILTLHPNIKMVVMVCGESHFYNLCKLISASDTLKMEPEFLQILYSVYELAKSYGIPNYLLAEDGIP